MPSLSMTVFEFLLFAMLNNLDQGTKKAFPRAGKGLIIF
jgi:hypothetical protein